jgi:hypothetical protein
MINVGAFLQNTKPPSLLGRPAALLGRVRTSAPGLAYSRRGPSQAIFGPVSFFSFSEFNVFQKC